MLFSKTELKNILRIHGYTLTTLADDIGITKSYLSKIISRKVVFRKYENLIAARVFEIQKIKPKTVAKKRTFKYFKYFSTAGIKDIPLRNGIQIILDNKKMTVSQLARDINEAQSSVSQVIIGLRHTERIREKIINYLNLDRDIFFNRTYGDIKDLEKGILVPLPTKARAKERKRDQAKFFKNMKASLPNIFIGGEN